MKIDITSLKGYRDDMTAEEKLELLNSSEFDFVSKDVFDKKASERAKYSRELKEKRSEEENEKAERDTELAELKRLVKNLEDEKTHSAHTARFLGLGFDEKSAKDSATALMKGDMDTVFKNVKALNDKAAEKAKADLMKGTPAPVGGSGGSNVTKEQFDSMSYTERAELFANNKALYDELSK